MARVIVVTSGKGGVGKTSVTSNLGVMLSQKNSVCMIDADLGLKNLDAVLGIENRVIFDIEDVIENRASLMQALVNDKKRENLYILPACRNLDVTKVDFKYMEKIVLELQDKFDYIFIDCPAGIDVGFHRAVSCVNEALIIVNSSLTSLRDADKVVSILKSYKLENVGLIINRVRGDLIANQKTMTPFDIENLLKTELVGVLPEEDAVFLSCGFTLPKMSDSKKAYKILANNLHKNAKKIFDTTQKYTGFLGSIRRSIKKSI